MKEVNIAGGLTVRGWVPDRRGAEPEMAAGARKLTMSPSAARAHSLNKIGKTPEEAIEEVRRVCALRDSLPIERRPDVEVGISTAFGCTLEGTVSEDWGIEMAGLLATAGADSNGLFDKTGSDCYTQLTLLTRSTVYKPASAAPDTNSERES